jgi:hypothetical protein
MDTANKSLKTITRWAAGEERLRAMLLVSPYAQPRQIDRLSSINLQLFGTDPEWFVHTDNWLSLFSPY